MKLEQEIQADPKRINELVKNPRIDKALNGLVTHFTKRKGLKRNFSYISVNKNKHNRQKV